MSVLLDVEAIEAAIDQLYAHELAPEYDRDRATLTKAIDMLRPASLRPMLEVGERRLQELSDRPEDVNRINFSLHLIFDFFEGRRLAQIRPLIERALQNKLFNMKEQYIQTLEEFGDPASVLPLVRVLSVHPSDSIEDEGIRATVLGSLAAYFPPLADPSPVVAQLADESLRVRRAALRYIAMHAVDTAGAALAARARVEDDPDLLDEALGLLARTDRAQAVAIAESRLASTAPSEAELIEQLQVSLSELRAQPH